MPTRSFDPHHVNPPRPSRFAQTTTSLSCYLRLVAPPEAGSAEALWFPFYSAFILEMYPKTAGSTLVSYRFRLYSVLPRIHSSFVSILSTNFYLFRVNISTILFTICIFLHFIFFPMKPSMKCYCALFPIRKEAILSFDFEES